MVKVALSMVFSEFCYKW